MFFFLKIFKLCSYGEILIYFCSSPIWCIDDLMSMISNFPVCTCIYYEELEFLRFHTIYLHHNKITDAQTDFNTYTSLKDALLIFILYKLYLWTTMWVNSMSMQTSQWLSLAMCFRSAIIWVLASDNTIGWESWWFFICSCRQSTIDLFNVVGKTLFLHSLCSHGKHYLVKFGFLFYLWSNV